jgi:hypothetical protein
VAKVHSQNCPAHLGGSLTAAGRLKYGLSDRGRPGETAMGKHFECVLGLVVSADGDGVSHLAIVRHIVLRSNPDGFAVCSLMWTDATRKPVRVAVCPAVRVRLGPSRYKSAYSEAGHRGPRHQLGRSHLGARGYSGRRQGFLADYRLGAEFSRLFAQADDAQVASSLTPRRASASTKWPDCSAGPPADPVLRAPRRRRVHRLVHRHPPQRSLAKRAKFEEQITIRTVA